MKRRRWYGEKERSALTEPMFYVLTAFLHRQMCGTEIAEFVETATGGRLRIRPGAPYTLLGKFQEERLIREIRSEGRRRTYCLTDKGRSAYLEELERLRACVRGGEAALRGETPAGQPEGLVPVPVGV